MRDIIATVTGWLTTYRLEAWTIGSIAALAVIAVIVYEITNRLRKTSGNLKEIIGYGVVQVGMAYVTITGGFDFWRHVANMPDFEAWAVAVIVESAQWWFIGRIFRYMRGTHIVTADDGTETTVRNEGYGPAGPKFWGTVVGGGTLAVIGGVFAPSGSVSLAIGRAVVVYIGASMFDLLLRETVFYADADTKKRRTTFLLTPRRLGVMLGILSPEERDLRADNREWTVRRMARAIRWVNDGWRLLRWLGKRTLLKAMETGDARLMSAATTRYAMGWVLTNEVKADHARMAAAFDAARAVLVPLTPIDIAPGVLDPPKPPDPEPEPVKLELPDPPVPVRRRVVDDPPSAPRPPSNAEAAALREQATAWAVNQIRQGNKVTARQVGTQFGAKEEWGRLRLTEARKRVGEVVPTASVNGRVPEQV